MNLKGKISIVTGSGGHGSGRAEAHRLASHECLVVVSDPVTVAGLGGGVISGFCTGPLEALRVNLADQLINSRPARE
jgi:NAD(P)-dependent dehydrogenase (short-subunit alcohol dehydrogenase family)